MNGPVGGAFGMSSRDAVPGVQKQDGRLLSHFQAAVRLSSQNLESKLASCREYINEQAAGRRSRAAAGQGAPSGHGNTPDNHPSNGLYSKG